MLDRLQNIVYDTNYTTQISDWGYVFLENQNQALNIPSLDKQEVATPTKNISFMDKILATLGLLPPAENKDKKTDIPLQMQESPLDS